MVVSNTSPLIFLHKVARLDLLAVCFGTIHIPPSVAREARDLILPPTIVSHTISAEGEGFVQGAMGSLHRGELEAIRLAREQKAELILLDDLLARRMALRLGLQVMGTLGVLLLANHRGYLPENDAALLLETLREQHDLYLSPSLYLQFVAALRQ